MASIDPDFYHGASHSNMAAHLSGPFAAGTVDTEVSVAPDGTIVVEGARREPVLLIAPAGPVGDVFCRVSAVLDPQGAATPIDPPLVFAPFTEDGTFLPLYAPRVDPQLRTTPGFRVRLQASFEDREGKPLAVNIANLSLILKARVLEGTLGKMIFILGAEKARLRRQAREMVAMRALSSASWAALDRFGGDLAVPRFSDRIQFDAAKQEIVTETLMNNGVPVGEADADYRRRLAVYHRWMMPTRSGVLRILNGPGGAGDPNRGALGELGLAQRLQINETNNAFALAVHMVAPGAPALLKNFQDHVANATLIWPANIPANNVRHAQRFLSTEEKSRVTQLRSRLRTGFTFGNNMAIAPALALALDRVGRVRQALGVANPLVVTRAFDAAGGSRYELGMGVDIQPIPAAELNAMEALLTGANPPRPADGEVRSLLRGAKAKKAAADPEGRWLLELCGLQTVHGVNAGTVYLSHLPTFGLVISEPAPVTGTVTLEARYHAPGDPGNNVILESALVEGAQEWIASGKEAFTRIADATAKTRWNNNTAQPAPVQNLFKAAGLPAIAQLGSVAKALDALSPELMEAIELGPVLSAQIVNGQAAAANTLRDLAELFRRKNLASILPFVSGPNQITVLVSTVGLPQAGVNLGERLSTGFRWYAVPIEGKGGAIKTVGSRSLFRPEGAGLTAIVVLGYARRGLVDPYEYRLEMEPNAMLNLTQYEFLMNVLERAFPIGVQVNTFSIRQAHVDLNGDNKAEPLPPSIFRTYRKFQRRRQRGEVSVGLNRNR